MSVPGMINYECPKCGYKMAAAMVIGVPKCPKDGTVLKKVP